MALDAIFKPGVQERLETAARVVVELGCGPSKRIEDAFGIDRHDFGSVDIVCDLDLGIPLPTGSVDELHSYHFLEHVKDLETTLLEHHRVLKPEGRAVHVTPHFSNPYFYSDYTHRSFFGLYTMAYFSKSGSSFERQVPQYYNAVDFELEDVQLHFLSPFKRSRRMKQLLERLVNRSNRSKEIYEEFFCFWFPAYEVRYFLRKR